MFKNDKKSNVHLYIVIAILSILVIFLSIEVYGLHRYGIVHVRKIHTRELIVNDIPIETNYGDVYLCSGENVLLPLTKVLSSLGCDIEWLNDDEAAIVYGEKTYRLSLQELSLTEADSDDNIIVILPGNDYYYCEENKGDIILDDDTLNYISKLITGSELYIIPYSNDHAVVIYDFSYMGSMK